MHEKMSLCRIINISITLYDICSVIMSISRYAVECVILSRESATYITYIYTVHTFNSFYAKKWASLQ